jgi:sugar phosphate isomerase/epimerase
MQLGVCHAVTLPGEWEAAIQQAGELGFAGLEVFARHPTALAELLDDPNRTRSIRNAAQQAGIIIPSVAITGFVPGFLLGDADPAIRRATVERCRLVVERCAELGGKVTMIPGAPSIEDTASVDRWVGSIGELVPTAASSQVILGLETNYDSPTQRRIVESLASPWVKDYFDVGNSAARGRDPVSEIRLRNSMIAQFHIKGVGKVRLDEGTVDLAAIVAAIRDIGYDRWLLLETPPLDAPVESARANLATLRAYL